MRKSVIASMYGLIAAIFTKYRHRSIPSLQCNPAKLTGPLRCNLPRNPWHLGTNACAGQRTLGRANQPRILLCCIKIDKKRR